MDNLLIWLVILAVLAVAFGPVFFLLPSKRERRLAALRTQARRLGLSVELQPVPKLGADLGEQVTAGGRIRKPMHPSVRYAVPLALELQRHPAHAAEAAEMPPSSAAPGPTDDWRLLRGPTGWLSDVDAPPPEGLAAQLLPLLAQLPEDAVAVDRQGRSLGCCWLESFPAQVDSVAGIKAALAEIAKTVGAWEAQVANQPRTP